MKLLSRPVRAVLERFGYVLWKRDFIRYGVIPFLDIQRLSEGFGRRIEVFFDVGANVGQTSELALASFPEALVWAFEPAPEVFARLATTASSRLFPQQVALGERNEDAMLYRFAQDTAGVAGSLVPNARFTSRYGFQRSEAEMVKCRTIDSFCEEAGIEKIDVLKIDVEGFELSVLKGAERMLSEGRIGFVYLEFNDLFPKDGTVGGALIPAGEYLSRFGLKYATSYTDFIHADREMFLCANALFALPRGQ